MEILNIFMMQTDSIEILPTYLIIAVNMGCAYV